MPITLQPAAGSALDLVSLSTVQAALAEVLPADTSVLATLVTAASTAVQRYCRRWFNAQPIVEIRQPQPGEWDKDQADLIVLSQYPVVGTPMLRAGWARALAVTNTSAANQEAFVGFTTSGDPQISLTNNGLSLTAVAAGVQTVTNVTWTTVPPYTTLGAAAAAINALGNGWQATLPQPSFAGLGAYQLYGSTACAGALAPGGALLYAFAEPLAFAGVEADTGCVWLAPGPWYGGRGATTGADWIWAGGGIGGSSRFRPPVLCAYTAGYATVPQDIQAATCLVVKALLQETQTDTRYDTETADGATVQLAALAERVVPAAAKKLLGTYRNYRVS